MASPAMPISPDMLCEPSKYTSIGNCRGAGAGCGNPGGRQERGGGGADAAHTGEPSASATKTRPGNPMRIPVPSRFNPRASAIIGSIGLAKPEPSR